MMMRVLIASVALPFIAPACQAAEQQPSRSDMERIMVELQTSHIAANVPPHAEFEEILQRDVRAYLVANKLPAKTLEIVPLRKEATQSGTSYPKFYFWISAADEEGRQIAGAMRIAAINRVRFEVTDFTSAASIRSDPASLGSTYPALLVPVIRQHAAAE